MACSECKKKKEFEVGNEILKSTNNVSKVILLIFGAWTILGIYGLYCLITKFL